MSYLGKLALCLTLVLTAAACEDRSTPPPPPTAAPSQPTAQVRPTAEKLLSSPQHTVRLSDFPLTMDVPEGWAVKTLLEPTPNTPRIMCLQGPTPNGPGLEGEIHIQLTQIRDLRPMTLEQVKAMEAEAQAQAKTDNTVKLVNVRELGAARVLEVRKILPAESGGADERGNPVVTTRARLDWTIQVAAPRDQAYTRYRLKFMDVTPEQYELDKDLLQKILATLRYDPTAAAVDLP